MVLRRDCIMAPATVLGKDLDGSSYEGPECWLWVDGTSTVETLREDQWTEASA